MKRQLLHRNYILQDMKMWINSQETTKRLKKKKRNWNICSKSYSIDAKKKASCKIIISNLSAIDTQGSFTAFPRDIRCKKVD